MTKPDKHGWNFDISQAPKGKTDYLTTGKTNKDGSPVLRKVHVAPRIIAAGNGLITTVSKWLPDEGRWEMFTKDVPPLAWMPWPTHPSGDSP